MNPTSLTFTADHVINIVTVIAVGFNALAVAIATPFAVRLANRQKQTDVKVAAVKTKTDEIHGQTVNHHPESPNMRDQNDERHAESTRMLTHISNKVGRQGDMMDELLILGIENRYRIEALEKGKS